MLAGIVFDMDGVLVDSEYTFLESKTEILKEAGFPKDISYQYQFMGTTFEFMWKAMKEELGLPLPYEAYIEQMNQKRADMMARDGVRAIKGAQDLVQGLASSGIKIAVASSSPKNEIVHVLRELGIADYFQAVVSSEEVAHSKPEPDVFLEAAKQLGVDPKECVAFEDTKNGSLSAKRAGMYVIGFENPDYPAQDLSNANHVVKTYDGLTFDVVKELFDNK